MRAFLILLSAAILASPAATKTSPDAKKHRSLFFHLTAASKSRAKATLPP
ncbi:hypothetical protein [Mesorhizobium captivum]|nr:hypothetical protein [Mesorhizobium sp. VK23E]MDX8515084.1 hypothetical protein [Mesorhizobium sp. VK23E]